MSHCQPSRMAVTCHCHSPRAHDSDPKEMTAPVPLQLCPRFPSIPVKHSALGASTPTLDPQRRWASDPRLSGPTWRRGRARPAVRPSPMSLSRQGVANEFLDHLRSLVLTGVSLHLAVLAQSTPYRGERVTPPSPAHASTSLGPSYLLPLSGRAPQGRGPALPAGWAAGL